LVTVLLLHVIFCDAQFYQLRNFNSESGLPSSDVYGLIQDSKGYMWFGTDMGVSRYNGYEFKNYSTENGLPDNTVLGFYEDSKQRVWFRSLSGKLSYFQNDSIYTIPCNAELEKLIQFTGDVPLSIYISKNDTIYLGSRKNFIKITPPWKAGNVFSTLLGIEGEYIYHVDANHIIYGGKSPHEGTLRVYSNGMKELACIETGTDFSQDKNHRFFSTLLHDGTYLASVANIVCRFNQKGILCKAEEKNMVIDMLETPGGEIISGSYGNIRIYKNFLLNDFEEIPEMEGKTVTGSVIDYENSLWFSTEGGGVYCIPFRNNKYYTSKDGLPASKITALHEKDGALFTGHLGGTITLIKGNEIRAGLSLANDTRPVSCFYSMRDAVYAFSTGGIGRLEGKTFEDVKRIPFRGVKLIASPEGRFFWVAMPTHIQKLDREQNFKVMYDTAFSRFTNDIFIDREGVVWICAIDGIWNITHDHIYYLGNKQPIFKNRFVHILQDDKGRMWMASRGKGVIIKDGETFRSITTKDGLTDNMCRNMFLDSNNVMWVGSNKGLNRIEFDDVHGKFQFKVSTYTTRHGLLTNEVNFITRKGNELVLAHNAGISLFNPHVLKSNTHAPPAYIVQTDVGEKSYKHDSIQFYFGKQYVKINYVGLSYKNPGSVEYRYRMKGLDTTWVQTKYTSAHFPALYPGEYTFEVYARNDDGYWSVSPASVHIVIFPLWYQTWWFTVTLIFLAGLILYLLFRLRFRRIQKREREKIELEGKLALTELKALRTQMNPHFIFNSLTSIESFIYEHQPKEAGRYLSDFSRLMRLILENSASEYISLQKEIETLNYYLKLQKLRLNEQLNYKIEVDQRLDTELTHLPPMLTQPFIENAIEHAFRGSKTAGEIHVMFKYANPGLKVEITDNGIGILKAEEQKQLNKKHASMAMKITQERLTVLNKYKKEKMDFVVTDLSVNGKEQTGTKITFLLP
jgi:hypothetical protein